MSESKYVLILSDQKPGHFKQSEGVCLALNQIYNLNIKKIAVPSYGAAIHRLLYRLSKIGFHDFILKYFYKIDATTFKDIDIVVSAGGATLVPNILLSNILNAQNIFCGTTRKFPINMFDVVIWPQHVDNPEANVLVALKPNVVNPNDLPAPRNIRQILIHARGSENPNSLKLQFSVGVLIGGPTQFFQFKKHDYVDLLRGLTSLATDHDISLCIVTSRRTPEYFYSLPEFLELTQRPNIQIIDFRGSGSGTITPALGADAILVTNDSMSMITEAVVTKRPVLVISPVIKHHHRDDAVVKQFKELGWLDYLQSNEANTSHILSKLERIKPLDFNHIEKLARLLKLKLQS